MSKSKDKFNELVEAFYDSKRQAEEANNRFENQKRGFYVEAEEFFKNSTDIIDKTYYFDTVDSIDNLKDSYSVTRVQKVDINFDVEALRESIGKDKAKRVIKKKYTILDFDGLVGYLRSCGVDPKKFSSYLNVESSIDTKALDKMFDLGEITKEQVEGCYTTKSQNPYFVVKKSKAKDSSDGEESK